MALCLRRHFHGSFVHYLPLAIPNHWFWGGQPIAVTDIPDKHRLITVCGYGFLFF